MWLELSIVHRVVMMLFVDVDEEVGRRQYFQS
jgi:hypothetical protein